MVNTVFLYNFKYWRMHPHIWWCCCPPPPPPRIQGNQLMIIKINQLPVFATRGQFKDMFCNFQLLKNHKYSDNSRNNWSSIKTMQRFGNPQNFRNILMYVWHNLKTIKYYLWNEPLVSNDNQAFYWVKHPHWNSIQN